jgi:hypothetical protein
MDQVILVCRACGYSGPVITGRRRLLAFNVAWWTLLGVLTIGMVPTCALLGKGPAFGLLVVGSIAFAAITVLELTAGLGKEVIAKCPACLAELGSLSGLDVRSRLPQPAEPAVADTWACACGTTNRLAAKHCKSCGKPKNPPQPPPAPEEVECAECGTTNDGDAKFCEACGVEFESTDPKIPSTFRCSGCGNQVEFGATECPRCGDRYRYNGNKVLREDE